MLLFLKAQGNRGLFLFSQDAAASVVWGPEKTHRDCLETKREGETWNFEI